MNRKISDKDKKDWENFLSNKEKLVSKDQENKIKNYNKIRTIDLHGQSLDEANNKIKDFITSLIYTFSNGIQIEKKGFYCLHCFFHFYFFLLLKRRFPLFFSTHLKFFL